jgi:MYXO-CTERM domain-containing protein
MSKARAARCTALLALVTACGQAGPEPLAQRSDGIYGGHESGPEDDGIVKVTNVDANGVMNSCTGSLVAPNVVLTARHCVSNLVEGNFTCTDAGELTADSKGGRFGALIDASKLTIYVGAAFKEPVAALGAKVFATQTPTICRNDLAVIVLDREISGAPIMPVRLDRGNERGEVLRVVGYGQTEDSTAGVRRAKEGLTISQVGTSTFRPNGDAIPPRTFLTLGPALCIGDSGGPALSSAGAVTGIYSQLVGACNSPNARQYFTQVAPFAADVIAPAFELAGYEPIAESSSTNGGDAGAAGAPSPGEEAGAPGTGAGGNQNGSGGAAGGNVYRSPPGKGGCACSTIGRADAGWLDRGAMALLLGGAGLAVARRRRRNERAQ